MSGLKQEKTTLQSDLSTLQQKNLLQKQESEDLERKITDNQATLTKLKADYEAIKKKNDYEITLQESKKRALEQENIEIQHSQEKIRENLASWQKTLEEKEKNLRIREEKADMQERAIIRNHKLLKL